MATPTEATPLLSEEDTNFMSETKSDVERGIEAECEAEDWIEGDGRPGNKDVLEAGTVLDTMTYDMSMMVTWQVFTVKGVRTAWHKRTTWTMIAKLFLLSLSVSFIFLFTVRDPGQVQGSKFKEVGLFLRVFVGLLLGFFLTSSVSRWYSCVHGFMELFDAVRNLQMQFLALGVHEELRFQCIRYGVISGFLLDQTLEIALLHTQEEKDTATGKMWASVQRPGASTNKDLMVHECWETLTPEEVNLLARAEDPPGMMWYWVASLVGRMAQDGNIPPMASPTYGRIMNLAQDAHGGIRVVKQSITVQAPFIYVHMLAALVHINNIISAVSFGITTGTLVLTCLVYSAGQSHIKAMGGPIIHRVDTQDVIADFENFIVMIFVGLVGPLLYQSILDVSIDIAQPFVGSEGRVPTGRFLHMLRIDLHDAQRMLRKPPGWDPPCFKQPH